MSDKLKTLIDNYIALQDKNVFLPQIDEKNKVEYVEATKKKLYDTIYDEIKTEIRDEAVKEAEATINKRVGLKRISESKKLMLDGFIVAICVGLFVNQFTDFIGFFKGSVTLKSIWPTVVIASVFLIICILIFLWLFATELIKLVKKEYDDENDRD